MIVFFTLSVDTPTRPAIYLRESISNIEDDSNSMKYLSLSSVLIQSCEAGEVSFRDGRSTLGTSHGIGVSWVANDNDLEEDTQQCMKNKMQHMK